MSKSSRFWLLYKGVSGIYKITNKKTENCYIGASCNIGRRWTQHLNCTTLPIQKDIQEIGPENFTFEVVEVVEKNRLREREKYWITELNPFYNKDEKGSYPTSDVSSETRRKHSEINKTRTYYKDPEYLRKQSEAHKGLRSSKETREKMSSSLRGKPKSETWKQTRTEKHKFFTENGEIIELNNNIAARFINQGRKLTRVS